MPASATPGLVIAHANTTDANLGEVFERWLYGADHVYDGVPLSGPEGVFIVDTGGAIGPFGETYAVLAGAFADPAAPAGPWEMAGLALYDRHGGAETLDLVGGISLAGIDSDRFDALMRAYDGYATFSFEDLFAGFDIQVSVAAAYASPLDYEFQTAPVIFEGGAAGDRIVAGGAADTLAGRGGADEIRSGGGADRIDGGAGADFIDPGAGADTIAGGTGADDVSVDMREMDGDVWIDFEPEDELILRDVSLADVRATFSAEGWEIAHAPRGGPLATMDLMTASPDTVHGLMQVGADVIFTTERPPEAQDDLIRVVSSGVGAGNLFADNGAGADVDPEGRALTVAAVSFGAVGESVDLAEGGRIRVAANGDVWFNPDGDFDDLTGLARREVSIDYTVVDDSGATDTATATFSLGAANRAPVAQDQLRFNFGAETSTGDVFESRGFGADADPDGDALTVTRVGWITSEYSAAAHGFVERTHWADVDGPTTVSTLGRSFTIAEHGGFAYDAGPGGQGEARWLYQISDGRGGTDEGRVDFISSASTPGYTDPLIALDAVDDALTTDQAAVLVGSLLADNGAGEDGHPRFSSGLALIATSRPGGSDEPYLRIPFGGVLSIDGDLTLVGRSFDLAGGGRAQVAQDGRFIFNPDGDFNDLAPGESRETSFTYELTDSFARDSAVATFTVSAPVGIDARDDAFAARAGGLLAGDLFADNGDGADAGVVRIARAAGQAVGALADLADGGSLRVREDGRFWFDAGRDFDHLAAGEVAEVRFAYTAAGGGAQAPAEVVIEVHGNAPPVPADDLVTTGPGRLSFADLFADNGAGPDTDPDGDGLRVVAIDGEALAVGVRQELAGGAAWRLYEDGRLWVNARAGFEDLGPGEAGSFGFDYTVRDAVGHLATAHVTVMADGDLAV